MEDLPGERIAIYAGSGKSGIWQDNKFTAAAREDIKLQVRLGEIRLLLGTESASEGLNLQRLGTLINLDLPWNPTRLEQRKGRIQRIGQLNDTGLRLQHAISRFRRRSRSPTAVVVACRISTRSSVRCPTCSKMSGSTLHWVRSSVLNKSSPLYRSSIRLTLNISGSKRPIGRGASASCQLSAKRAALTKGW